MSREERKQDFIRRHADRFPICDYDGELIQQAIAEGLYKPQQSNDVILMGLSNAYRRMMRYTTHRARSYDGSTRKTR